jgi:hypothetical protein
MTMLLPDAVSMSRETADAIVPGYIMENIKRGILPEILKNVVHYPDEHDATVLKRKRCWQVLKHPHGGIMNCPVSKQEMRVS